MREGLKIRFLLFAVALLISVPARAVSMGESGISDLQGQFYLAEGERFPASTTDLLGWLSKLHEVEGVSLLGGSYWFRAELRNDAGNTQWVLEPDDRLIDSVEVRVYGQGGDVQRFVTGYRAEHDYMLHSGKAISLPRGSSATVLIHFESPYYASVPKVNLFPERAYRHIVFSDDTMALAAFGALLTLACYNLFIYWITRDRTLFYYAAYMIAYFFGWAFTFQLPAELFGWHDLHLHYIWFFLLHVLNTLFYMEFLKLRVNFPRLAAISRINIVLPLVLLPSCFFALPYAHLLATAVISLWLSIALVCGIVSLANGFRPARYFVLAFIALLVPGIIILPANLGLVPEIVRNSELFTLLGGTLDGILLAFGVADKIRALAIEKEHALQRLSKMLALTRTDHLTGIANRHAFDQIFKESFHCPDFSGDPDQLMLFLIDLDGLKRVNDCHGHSRGDELLRVFAKSLAGLESGSISAFRLGGDEFTLLAQKRNEAELVSAMARFEADLREQGFTETGISYGIAYAGESTSSEDMLIIADSRMYDNKVAKRQARATDAWLVSPVRDIA
ncbi:MAG: sensor domain-containing diguanylate cyclase [Burkholderiales bacterium]|nr:sensor domain-containing diguanylate cyclase [Burkholderiales bacterium]